MKLKVSSGGVPIGSYTAQFKSFESVENDFGAGLKWSFEITAGPCAGMSASRTTSVCPTSKNACGKLLSGITGFPLTVGTEIDVSSYIGRTYLIVVAETQNGSTRVEAVTPLPIS